MNNDLITEKTKKQWVGLFGAILSMSLTAVFFYLLTQVIFKI